MSLSHRILLGHGVARKDLEALGLSGPAIEGIFSKLDKKRWLRKRLNISRFQRDVPKSEGVTAKSIFEVFRGLEKLGIGIIENENGESFFKWKPAKTSKTSSDNLVDLITEASSLLSESTTPEDRGRTNEAFFKRGPTKLEWEPGGDFDCVFPLRRDRTVIFRLPGDFTPEEAERLAAYIKSLAIPVKPEQKK